jgi:hypothetical protein
MHQVPVGRQSVFGGIHAHRRNADAIPECDGLKRERIKQVRHKTKPSIYPKFLKQSTTDEH